MIKSIVRVLFDDWEQLFTPEGELLEEGHSVDARTALEVVGVEVETVAMDDIPNDNFEVDNLANDKNLAAIRAAREAHDD
jgi:hypothetical protein